MEESWTYRFFIARKTLDLRNGSDISDVDFGARVARRLGRAAYQSSSVSQWRTQKQIPPPEVQLAIAQECGVDPGWLTYGPYSQAPKPALLGTIDVAMAAEALPHPELQAKRHSRRPPKGVGKEEYARRRGKGAKPAATKRRA